MYTNLLLTTYNQLKNNPVVFDEWVKQLSEADMDTVSNWLIDDIEVMVSVVT